MFDSKTVEFFGILTHLVMFPFPSKIKSSLRFELFKLFKEKLKLGEPKLSKKVS
jgi:hypothetical protein